MHGRDSCQLFDLDDGINLQSFHSGQVYRGTVKGERQLVDVRSGGHFRFKVEVKMFKEPLLPQCYVANYFIILPSSTLKKQPIIWRQASNGL